MLVSLLLPDTSFHNNVIIFTGATALFGSAVAEGTGQIVLSGLNCSGTEPRLVDCPQLPLGGATNCAHSEDVGVRCVTTTPPPGMYRPHTLEFGKGEFNIYL